MKIYKDGRRWIVGPDEQGCTSMTDGYADYDSYKQAKAGMERLKKLSTAELAAKLRVFWTDQRFEQACDNGKFGPSWD